MRRLAALLTLLMTVASASAALAATYHVGSGQQYATIQDLLAEVSPVDHDTILVHSGRYPAFRITKGGGTSPETAPVIRAYDRASKPVFDAQGERNVCEFNTAPGTWWILDGVEICNGGHRGAYNVECGLVLRNCYLHHNRNGLMGGQNNSSDATPGYLIAEYNEFDHNGNGVYAHQLYVQEYWTIFRHNYIHDNTGGVCYKDRSRYSLIAYNYMEQGEGGLYTVELCGCGSKTAPSYTQVAIMIGNIITKKHGGNRWLFIANIRKEGGARDQVNTGVLHLINNTLYTEEHTGPMLGEDEGSVIYAHNNIFHSATCDRVVDQVDMADGPGKFGPSYNNWVRTGMSVPKEFAATVFGEDPGCLKVAWQGGDFHLKPGSPCVDAGIDRVTPLPWLEYVHPRSYKFRIPDQAVDIGAFEYRPKPAP